MPASNRIGERRNVNEVYPELADVLGADRFVQEITTTASLEHPNTLPLFGSGEADSFLYYGAPLIVHTYFTSPSCASPFHWCIPWKMTISPMWRRRA
jgi:hypothetical protein